jgi:hypothetical protein
MTTHTFPSVALFVTRPELVTTLEAAVPPNASLIFGAGTGHESIACGIFVLDDDAFSRKDGTADEKRHTAIVHDIERYQHRLSGAPLVVVIPAGAQLAYTPPPDCLVISAASLETDLWRSVRRLVLQRDLAMLQTRVEGFEISKLLEAGLHECLTAQHLVGTVAEMARRLRRTPLDLYREWGGDADEMHGLDDAVMGILVLRLLLRRAELDPHHASGFRHDPDRNDDEATKYVTGLSLQDHDVDGTFRHKLLLAGLLLSIARRETVGEER